jgi:hypothetical protein
MKAFCVAQHVASDLGHCPKQLVDGLSILRFFWWLEGCSSGRKYWRMTETIYEIYPYFGAQLTYGSPSRYATDLTFAFKWGCN